MNKDQINSFVSNSNSILARIHNITVEDGNESSKEAGEIYNKLYPLVKEFNEGANSLLDANKVLQIGVVGQVKAGKSSFLNSLFFDGESVLPKASTPMTAGLTVLEYAEENSFVVEYFNKEDWNTFVDKHKMYLDYEKEVRDDSDFKGAPESRIRSEVNKRAGEENLSAYEMVEAAKEAVSKIGAPDEVQPFSNNKDLQNVLEKYVGANGKYTSVVKSLYIKLNDKRLEGYRIVDTPGVNDPVVSREERTKVFLRSCHCVMLLSSSSDFLGSADINFLNSRVVSQGIKCVLLLASKYDSVLQDIGAEYKMKGKSGEDLGYVVEEQIKKFKRRFAEEKKAIKGDLDVKVDYTSGIGYSIARKNSSDYDEVENTVVSNMKGYYPDYFANDADIKETFNGLSNIDDIKSNYLENWFLKNKDKIISAKIDNYFKENEVALKENFEMSLNNLKVGFDVLQKATAEEVEEQMKTQKFLFSKLENTIKKFISQFKKDLQSETNSICRTVSLELSKKIPTQITSRSIRHKTWKFFHCSDRYSYEQIDNDVLEDNLNKDIKSYLSEVNDKWRNYFRVAKDELKKQVVDAIYDAARDIQSAAFNDDYFRSIVNSVISDLDSFKDLDIKSLRNKLSDCVKRQCTLQYTPKNSYEVSGDDVPDILSKELAQVVETAKMKVSALKETVEGETSDLIQDSMKQSVSVASELEQKFVPKLNEVCEAYLSDLRDKLKKKDKATKDYQILIAEVEKLNGLLN